MLEETCFARSFCSYSYFTYVWSLVFYSTDASSIVQIPEGTQAVSREDENPESQTINNEEEEDTLPQLNNINETLEQRIWKLVDAVRKIWPILEKGDLDMEEAHGRSPNSIGCSGISAIGKGGIGCNKFPKFGSEVFSMDKNTKGIGCNKFPKFGSEVFSMDKNTTRVLTQQFNLL